MRPFVSIIRWCLIIGLWIFTVGATLMALAALARIFTGDEQFGALDGFQFTDALYKAVFRFILAVVAALALYRVLRWRPGRPEAKPIDPQEAMDQQESKHAEASPEKPFKGRPRAWVIPEEEVIDD